MKQRFISALSCSFYDILMLCNDVLKVCSHVQKYFNEKVIPRKNAIRSAIVDVVHVVHSVLKEVEEEEPRFVSSLTDKNGVIEGLVAHSSSEFEVTIFLNQMGVLNFVDDGSISGCAVLKLSDGRKRSMSLWVEFITASGFLSAKKIRTRFASIVRQITDKEEYRHRVCFLTNNGEVKLLIDKKYTVHIQCSFYCNGIWPRSANNWANSFEWPGPAVVEQLKSIGCSLVSREIPTLDSLPPKLCSSIEGDAWNIDFTHAENALISNNRKKALSMLKCLKDNHLTYANSPINYYIIKTLVLVESSKHPAEEDWMDARLGDRIIGMLLQLTNYLQCRYFPHFFLPHVDLFHGSNKVFLQECSHRVWQLSRKLLFSVSALDRL